MTLKDLTLEEEMPLMQELRRREEGHLNEEMYADDNLFQRFLRARNYDMNAAEQMLKNHINWRKIHSVDTILKRYTPPEILNFLPINRLGYDKEGFPVVYFHFGNIDYRGFLKSSTKKECVKMFCYWFEEALAYMKKESLKNGKNIDKWLYIYDFSNFSLAAATNKLGIDIVMCLALMYENNYPERLKTAYMINTSFVFTFLYTLMKPLASPRTMQKLKIFGREGWKEDLLKVIDADVLPAFLGGNRTDPDGDPNCRTFINHGGTIPERLYLIKSKNSLPQRPGMEKLEVPRMSKSEVEVEVLYPGSKLEWEFQTKNKDIAFSLSYKKYRNPNCPVKKLIPNHRIDTDFTSECGMFLCNTSGIYILEFDNSYSWIYNKEVFYLVSVSQECNLAQNYVNASV